MNIQTLNRLLDEIDKQADDLRASLMQTIVTPLWPSSFTQRVDLSPMIERDMSHFHDQLLGEYYYARSKPGWEISWTPNQILHVCGEDPKRRWTPVEMCAELNRRWPDHWPSDDVESVRQLLKMYCLLRFLVRTGEGAEAAYQFDSRKFGFVASAQIKAQTNAAVRQIMRKTVKEIAARHEARCKKDAEGDDTAEGPSCRRRELESDPNKPAESEPAADNADNDPMVQEVADPEKCGYGWDCPAFWAEDLLEQLPRGHHELAPLVRFIATRCYWIGLDVGRAKDDQTGQTYHAAMWASQVAFEQLLKKGAFTVPGALAYGDDEINRMPRRPHAAATPTCDENDYENDYHPTGAELDRRRAVEKRLSKLKGRAPEKSAEADEPPPRPVAADDEPSPRRRAPDEDPDARHPREREEIPNDKPKAQQAKLKRLAHSVQRAVDEAAGIASVIHQAACGAGRNKDEADCVVERLPQERATITKLAADIAATVAQIAGIAPEAGVSGEVPHQLKYWASLISGASFDIDHLVTGEATPAAELRSLAGHTDKLVRYSLIAAGVVAKAAAEAGGGSMTNAESPTLLMGNLKDQKSSSSNLHENT
jgi:hypothetical protein